MWDANTFKLLATLEDPSPVLSVAFSPDGARLLTGSASAARLWLWRAADLLKSVCDLLPSDAMGEEAWHSYLPNQPFRNPCAPVDTAPPPH